MTKELTKEYYGNTNVNTGGWSKLVGCQLGHMADMVTTQSPKALAQYNTRSEQRRLLSEQTGW